MTDVDILVVSLATTLGLRRSDDQLVEALERLGYTVARVTPDVEPWRRRLRRFAFRMPFMDLSEALATRLAVDQAVREHRPALLFYTTTTAALLEPFGRRRRSVLRFDSLARENRSGRGSGIVHVLERLTLRRALALMPLSTGNKYADLGPVTPAPPPVVAGPRVTKEPNLALCYVAGPKKRFDLIVDAWRLSGSGESGRRLAVAGMSASDTAGLLAPGTDLPPGVHLLGQLTVEEFREWTSRAQVFVAATDHEEFGIAQLEALADGALLVTTRASGSYEALRIAEHLTPDLTADRGDAVSLARALAEAWAMAPEHTSVYTEQARRLLVEFSQDAFDKNLRSVVTRWCGTRT